MIVTLENLDKGICWWAQNLEKWTSDFHNADYSKMFDLRRDGLNEDWWRNTVDRLGQWHAYRGRKPPIKKEAILQRGREKLANLQKEYEGIIGKCKNEPSITELAWHDVAGVFDLVSEIKPNSPVFAAKMCHFIFPGLFIVMDNRATDVFPYKFYWCGMKDEWEGFSEKKAAMDLLKNQITKNGRETLNPKYPLVTKIMELSYIGYKHGREVDHD